MKFLIKIFIILFFFTPVIAEESLKFFINAALKNNLELNAERKNKKSIKQNINISKSEFLPSLSVSGSQTSSQSTNRIDQSGANLSDTSRDTETTTISVDQKIFQGFKAYNDLKKSELEFKQADYKLLQAEKKTILDIAIHADLPFRLVENYINLWIQRKLLKKNWKHPFK